MAATATTTQTHPPNPLLKAPKGPTRSKLLCFSFAAYSKTIIDHLKSLHIPVFLGLTDQEFSSIESTFHFTFPPDLRSILQEGLPVHPSFPNWRSSSPQQLNILLNLPSLSLSRNIRFHNFWSDSWGSKPSNTNDALAVVKDLLRNAPLLVPVYRNCYIPSTPNLSGNPVFTSGVSKPFMRKKANSVNVNVPAWAATAPRRIEFWTEVEERGRRTVARGVTGGWWNRDEVEREGESRIGACMEEVFWRLREGGWKEEEVREMMMMIDGSDHNENKEMSRTQLMMDGEDAAWHVRVLSVVLLRAGWSREDVVHSLDLHDIIDDKTMMKACN
ncbi:hypothetical protein GOBAR_AA34910 [Gossypium barbadense]|uniref:Uncharacterized protein n=1 Tax=Gossypium barbadense TaxID=3634 RepID=A0A2P5W3X8_GOSBA|nr:hypothetical protein GOBAR_AA34910 [Gossypium barbadense]